MPSAWNIFRVIAGTGLILAGIAGTLLPVIPGVPLMLLGLTFGFTWHPRGLRAWRRGKTFLLRGLRRLRGT